MKRAYPEQCVAFYNACITISGLYLLSLQLCYALNPDHHPMEVDLVMILHLARELVSSVTQVTRLQEAGTEPAQPQVHGVGVRLLV